MTDFRAEFSASLTVHGAGADDAPVVASFVSRGFRVNVEFVRSTTPPFGAPDGEPAFSVGAVQLSASPTDRALAIDGNDVALLELVIALINRVVSALRNVGYIHSAQLVTTPAVASQADAGPYLRRFSVHLRPGADTEWAPLHPATGRDALFDVLMERHLTRELRPSPSGALPVDRFTEVLEAIEDGATPSPDQEFYVNALEHLDKANYRMAVVESVICLELCVASWMNEWLQRRGVSEQAIGGYFSKDVGIAARVAVMVPVMLHGESHAQFDQGSVLRLIKLRNAIAHKTGHIEGVPPTELRELISQTMRLALTATAQTRKLQSTERIATVQDDLYRACGVRPKIFFYPPRNYWASFHYPATHALPDEAVLRAAVDAIGRRISADDPRFRAERDLEVSFGHANRGLGDWKSGTLTITRRE